MGKKLDLTGQRFGQLTAIHCLESVPNKRLVWECLCDCGNRVEVVAGKLRAGHTQRCRDCKKIHLTKHGMYGTPTYVAWANMRQRCRHAYRNPWHAAKGISVCDRWDKFENFYADMGCKPEGMSLDRIDPSGNYCPENCRWASATEQSYNQRIHTNNTSGRTGVRYHDEVRKWHARIGKGGKEHDLGFYTTFEEAVAAREKAELELYGYNKQ